MSYVHKVGVSAEKAAGNRGMGRQKGVPNKLTKVLKEAILEAAENVGRVDVSTEFPEGGRPVTRRISTGAGGLVGYLEELALDEPVAFAGLLGKTLPKGVKVENNTSLTINRERAQRADRILEESTAIAAALDPPDGPGKLH